MSSIYEAIVELERQNRPAALCTVVRSQAPRRVIPAAKCWFIQMGAFSARWAAEKWNGG